MIFIIDGTRVNDVRVYDDEITPCLKSRMGTGGNNVPLVSYEAVYEPKSMGDENWAESTVKNALRAGASKSSHAVVQETDMTDVNGSDVAATLRGFGHGWQGQHNSTNAVAQDTGMNEPVMLNFQGSKGNSVTTEDGVSFSLNAMHGHDVHVVAQETDMTEAIPIQGTIIGRQDHNGPQGKGIGDEGDPMYTLDSVSQHGVGHNMVVRRLTPVECERLMGWPDNHTLPRADGKTNSDTTRYKMCGNGVASPVAQWIAEHIIAAHDNSSRL